VVNDLRSLLRENVEHAPEDHFDVDALLGAGRRRVRGRRTAAVGGAALLVAGVVTVTSVSLTRGADHEGAADAPPTPIAHSSNDADPVKTCNSILLAAAMTPIEASPDTPTRPSGVSRLNLSKSQVNEPVR